MLRVRDASSSVSWYQRLGFELEGDHTFGPGMPVYAFLRAGDQMLHLSEHEGDARAGTLLYVYVSDIDALAREFSAAIVEQPWAREIHVEDPDGNRLRIGQRRPRLSDASKGAPATRRLHVKPIEDPEVAAVFDGYPPKLRRKLLALRELILRIAASTDGVGRIEESLKWGQPAYLTSETRSGSTIRLQWKRSAPREYSICFHCQTTLVSDFREQFPHDFNFDGNRRLVFDENDRVPKGPLSMCIAMALTYHRDKKGRC